jgi:hypothetical protein
MGGHSHDVLVLVDADGDSRTPSEEVLEQSNQILLTSSPRTRDDQKWLAQHSPITGRVFVMAPCSWEETIQMGFVALISFVPSLTLCPDCS